ncbi:MAG TPA: hypothetical protein VFQ91_10940 [Bryobacteraceae bacterium]|nr:hypothetical protein [Bryobacteraceae bacterium]
MQIFVIIWMMIEVYSPNAPAKPRVLAIFSYPRCGSHYLTHCIRALYDTDENNLEDWSGVQWRSEPGAAERGVHLRGDAEARDRENELNPLALYALSLRANCGKQSPLILDHERNGAHGLPEAPATNERACILIRDPLAMVYSYYRVWTSRWEPDEPFDSGSVRHHLDSYCSFYDTALRVIEESQGRTILLRYEDLVLSPLALQNLCNFLSQTPKLEPEFVWHMTKFENFTRAGARSFYREGNNGAWRSDAAFCAMAGVLEDFDFRRYGYKNGVSYVTEAQHPVGTFHQSKQSEVG